MNTWQCPECGRRGYMIRRTPSVERVCDNGHRWFDRGARGPSPKEYTPMSVRLERAAHDIEALLGALDRVKLILRECEWSLTPEQRTKLALQREVYEIEETVNSVDQSILRGKRKP